MADFRTDYTRWRTSEQLIQSGGFLNQEDRFQDSWYKTADIRTADPRGGFQKSWSKMDSETADPRWRISKQLIQDDGFQSRWYKMADIRTAYPRFLKRWSKMADFIRVDPSRRISEQLNQDGGFRTADTRGGFQNSWSKMAASKTTSPIKQISGQLIQNGGFQKSWFLPEQKSEGQAEQWRPAKEGFSAFSSSYPEQR